MTTKRWLAVAALAAAGAAQAQQGPIHLYAGTGLTAGGKTLVVVEYTNGDTQRIRSGGLVELVGGLEYRQPDLPFSVRASAAYHTDSSSARDGSVRFSRWPLELLAFWHPDDRLSLGAGLRKATSVTLRSSGAASNVGDYDFGSRAGFVAEGEYRIWRGIGVALRYVNEKYTVPGAGEVDGSHVGVRFAWHF